MTGDTHLKDDNSLIISYLTLRRSIGYMGLLLPVVLWFLARALFSTGLQPSLSAYYHTDVRSVFVGTLCVLGAFLVSYKGYEKRPSDQCKTALDEVRRRVTDNSATNLAGICAVGLAMFPTAPTLASSGDVLSQAAKNASAAHLAFTAVFFLALVYMSAFMFTMTEPGTSPHGDKVNRNRIYRICAAIMVLCLLLIVYVKWRHLDTFLGMTRPVFYLEAGAIIAFGVSWLVKGDTLGFLSDE